MAQSGIPAGQQPQNSNDPSNNPQPNPSANQPNQLVGGKYQSIDEFVKASEQGYHDLSEKLSRVVRVLEAAADNSNQPAYGVPVGQPGSQQFNADPYGRAPQYDPDYVDPKDFIMNPGEVLRKRDQRIRQELTNQFVTVVQDVVGNAMTVADFKATHPEMKQHEALMESFMQRTDRRKPLAERLEDARKLTVGYLQANGFKPGNQPSATPQNQPALGNSYEPNPAAGAVGATQAPNAAPGEEDEEADFHDYIRGRNAEYAAKFGIVDPSNQGPAK